MAGAALETYRVACFFVNRIGRAASSGDKVQIPWLLHLLKIDGSLARNINFEVANFQVLGSRENS